MQGGRKHVGVRHGVRRTDRRRLLTVELQSGHSATGPAPRQGVIINPTVGRAVGHRRPATGPQRKRGMISWYPSLSAQQLLNTSQQQTRFTSTGRGRSARPLKKEPPSQKEGGLESEKCFVDLGLLTV